MSFVFYPASLSPSDRPVVVMLLVSIDHANGRVKAPPNTGLIVRADQHHCKKVSRLSFSSSKVRGHFMRVGVHGTWTHFGLVSAAASNNTFPLASSRAQDARHIAFLSKWGMSACIVNMNRHHNKRNSGCRVYLDLLEFQIIFWREHGSHVALWRVPQGPLTQNRCLP